MRPTRPAGDTGEADPAVTAALAAYAAGQATERATLAAITAARLLVPVVAVRTEAGEDGAASPAPASGRSGPLSSPDRSAARSPLPRSSAQDRGAPVGSRSGKESEMALPTLIGNDGRKAVIAFTGTEALRLWRPDARPVPVPAPNLWPAVSAEQADAVVIDVAGPVQLVIEGARLAALAAGQPPPPAWDDPDIRATIAAVTEDCAAGPGPEGTDLVITLRAAGEPEARALAGELARLLYPRLRRVEFRATVQQP